MADSRGFLQHHGDGSIDFAILTATEVERRAICAAFDLGDDHRVKKGSRVYWRGKLPLKHGEFYELVIAQSPDMANVDAALLTSDLLHHWSPGAALMVGIAASARPNEAKLGDVVVGSDVYYYERGKETPQGRNPEPKIVPADATLWSNVTALPDWKIELPVSRPDGTSDSPKVHFGVIASGEKMLADEAIRDRVAAEHWKTLAIEMEGYGFSKAVWQSFDQVRHLVLRGICDEGSLSKNDKWHGYAATAAAAFARHFLLDHPLEPTAKRARASRITEPAHENDTTLALKPDGSKKKSHLRDKRRNLMIVASFASVLGIGALGLAASRFATSKQFGPSESAGAIQAGASAAATLPDDIDELAKELLSGVHTVDFAKKRARERLVSSMDVERQTRLAQKLIDNSKLNDINTGAFLRAMSFLELGSGAFDESVRPFLFDRCVELFKATNSEIRAEALGQIGQMDVKSLNVETERRASVEILRAFKDSNNKVRESALTAAANLHTICRSICVMKPEALCSAV